MSWVFEAFGRWYPVVYPHRDGAEAERLVHTLGREVVLDGARVLDVGCGAGRHLIHLRRAGARPIGLDLSEELLAEARRVRAADQGDWPLVRADMRALPVREGRVDGVTSLFTTFGYFTADDDAEVLREAARVLRPGGFHLLDFLNRERVLAHPNPDSERVSGEYLVRERRWLEDDDRRIVKEVTILPASGETELASYEERVTLYGEDEIRALLTGAGLTIRREWGEYDGEPFGLDASRHVFLSVRGEG